MGIYQQLKLKGRTKMFSSLEILEAYRGETSDNTFLWIDFSENWTLVHIKRATMFQPELS